MNSIGKYSIIKELGSGATSKVFLAIDTFTNQQVALKLIELKSIRDSASAKAFMKLLQVEASLVGKLRHPHIMQMLDAVIANDLSYIVLEYVDGGSLEKYTEPGQLLPFTTVAEIMYKCCKALEYAQAHGVIHRDIKPANIMLQGNSDVKISDFGAAMVADGDSTMVIGVGSPYYMSPEQITGEALTHQTDIYSLGVTMYQLLTGNLPFQASSRPGLIFQIVQGGLPPPKTHREEIPQQLDAIVQHATAKELSQRYQAWGDFARDLASFLNINDGGKNSIFDAEKFDAMRATPFFQKFSDVELWEVLNFSKWHKVSRGTSILKEGSMGNAFFILTSGVVKVIKGGKMVCYLQKGDCFGEIKRAQGSNYVRTTGVESESDCVLFEIDLSELAKASADCRLQFSEAFLLILMNRLEMANTRIAKLSGQVA